MAVSDTSPPQISVVIPSLNQGRYLGHALESIFRQGYPALEVVVMDGGSTDDSLSVIHSYEKRIAFWKSCADGGQASAINEGVRRSRGQIVAWLNSDDFYVGESLWTVAAAYSEKPAYGLYIGNGLRYCEREDRYTAFCRRHIALNRRALAEGIDYVLQPATFFLRSAWDEVEGLRADLHFCMDWDIILRIARRRPAVLINEFLAASREHDETKTSRGRLARVFEIVRMIREHTRREVTPGGLHYLLETLFRLEDHPLSEDLRPRLAASFGSVAEHFRREYGNADGFPEKGDPQDAIFLPFAKGSGPARLPPGETGSLPSISVVVPSLNQARFLSRAIDSIINQGYPGLEILAFDGGSTDGSVEILRRYEGPRMRWVSEPDRGPAHAINKGLAAATGDVLGWLNSDDMLAEGALIAVGGAFLDDPELDMVVGNALYVDEMDHLHVADHGKYRTALYYGEAQPYTHVPAYWSYVHAIPQPTVFFRRRLLESCGALDESYHFIFDFELFFRFASRAKIRKLERTQAFYRIHASAKTSNWQSFEVELYRFSRPLWPRVFSREFRSTWSDFLINYLRRRLGPDWRSAHRWPVAALAALSSLTGVGNPESWRVTTSSPGPDG